MQNIQDIIEQINNLQNRLSNEIQKKEKEYFYRIKGKKVFFEKDTKKYHKTLVTKIHTFLYRLGILHIIVGPIIWFCLVPILFLDLVASAYQFICFPVYKIPKVTRSDYVVIDRHALKYLNAIEKLYCIYCGYFNGTISYIQEIAARTEQYYCPIKHARKIGTIHSRYNKFLAYGDADSFTKEAEKIRRDFEDLK